MLEHVKMQNLDDYFLELESRLQKGVYFYRINGYSNEIDDFIQKYYEEARKMGVVIEGRIPNPDEKNLAYYNEIMGMQFEMNVDFISSHLGKWLPRMQTSQRQQVAEAIYHQLEQLKQKGKTDNMLKNAYIKFMCWLYYKFERIVNQLGNNHLPKILYEGSISNYELMLITILSHAGCDVVLLQYAGDQSYLQLDPNSEHSDVLQIADLQPFPEGYSLQLLNQKAQDNWNRERLYGTKPQVSNCTNAWITGNVWEDLRKSVVRRGEDPKFFYNCFCRMNGVEDKLTYPNELLQFRQELENAKRRVVVVNKLIPIPTMEEISAIKRSNYTKLDQLIMELQGNISDRVPAELQKLMRKVFVDCMYEEEKIQQGNLNKITNQAVYLLCWLKRYGDKLFANWKMPEIACFIYMGGCKTEQETFFVRFLARLPVDVIILCPNLNYKCCLTDKLLYEKNDTESLSLDVFPEQNAQMRMGTVAYHAERELDTLMYQDTGLYRNQQYSKANIINLQTMYEEIKILWDQELKYRPNFSTVDETVNMPVIFAKISGVKDGLVAPYWVSVKELITEDTIVVRKAPYISPTSYNPMKAFAAEFYKNGRLLKNVIKQHPKYPYSILREEMQDFVLDQLENLIHQKLIKGIGENGTEFTAIAQILNMPKEILRMLQKFDFTKKNPKIVYINTTETLISLEDSILLTFLHLVGFDIVFFVPTGYQSIEKYFAQPLMEEHQIGEYKYDLKVPDFKKVSAKKPSWADRLFGRC